MKRLPIPATSVFGTILGLVAALTIALHISMASTSLTGLETALFSILQFVFSVAFAWVLSRASFRREFAESQKKFAVAAYRRICEIDIATNRLMARINGRFPDANLELSNELQVLAAIAVGIRQSAKSSIADWADIIGEEIEAMEQIAELKDEHDALLGSRSFEGASDTDGELHEMGKRLNSLEKELDGLTKKLPPSLRVISESRGHTDPFTETRRVFQTQLREHGFIELQGCWEPDKFERSIEDFSPGSKMVVGYGDAVRRTGALLLKDDSGQSVGVIVNNARVKYREFSDALVKALGKSTFPVSLVEIDDPGQEGKRVYFRIRTYIQSDANQPMDDTG